MRDKFGIFGNVIRIRKLSLLWVMMLRIPNKCYSPVLDDRQLADLAFQGLLPHIRDKYDSQEFESLSHLVQRISQDVKPFEPKRAWNKKVSFVDEATSSGSDEEQSSAW